MSSSKSSAKKPRLSQSDIKFYQLAAFVMLTTAACLAALWAPAVSYAHWESDRLVEEGRQARGAEAQTDFLLATHLNRGNIAAHLELARMQIASGHPDEAIATLDRAGEGSEPQRLKIRTLIELGRYAEAADSATALVGRGKPSDADIELTAMALLLANRSADVNALTSKASAQDTTNQISREAASRLVLAQGLYATSLPGSAASILESLPSSYDRDLLLARIYYARHGQGDLPKAADLLRSAINQNPTAIDGRRMLILVSNELGDPATAAHQATLITRLTSQRP